MLEKIKYINNQNEVVAFGKEIYANYNDLRNYKWDYDTDFNQITNFRRGIANKNLPLLIYAETEEKGLFLKNKIFEVFEKDVLMNKKGKFIIGDYYYKCFIVEGNNSEYLFDKRLLKKDVKIITDEPYWIKETKYDFIAEDETNTQSSYPYSYPYGYSSDLSSRNILNENFVKSNIEIIIYGPAVNPTVFINTHPYIINTTVLEGEYITISTKDKTIIKTKVNGERINEFHRRSKEYSVFQQIRPGSNMVSWDETFNFSIIVIEERSEPKWI